jgi:transposase-like protein
MSKQQSTVSDAGGVGQSPASRYSGEFKQDAVRLVSQEKYLFKAAAAVNVSEKILRE